MVFEISQHVDVDSKGRAVCPSCRLAKGATHKKKNLSIDLESGAYHCFAGCSSADIRQALNQPKGQVIPTALAKPAPPQAVVTVTPQQVKQALKQLEQSDGPAKRWLLNRGITAEMVAYYKLGIIRKRVGKNKKKMLPAISIPIPADDAGTRYYQKARIAPWLTADEQPEEYEPWSQYGVPRQAYFTWNPSEATQTYLCEGEWDAIMLGWLMLQAGEQTIAVATFTCGSGNVPPPS